MKRSAFRNLWLIVVVLLLGAAYFMFNKAEKERSLTSRAQSLYMQLKRERRNVQNLSASLEELDQLTIDEKTSTRLDILRHLGIETKNYTLMIDSKNAVQEGDVVLYVRSFDLEAQLPYNEALALADTLHANKKVVLSRFEVRTVDMQNVYGDVVDIGMKGFLYGLEKR